MKIRRILITGGTGQIGRELRSRQWPDNIQLIAPTRSELELSDSDNLYRYVEEGNFCAVINCGAYTAVDRAEHEVVSAWKINALGPAAIAAAAKKRGIPIVHISTDYVFDGLSVAPYTEGDRVAPLGVYGASKEAGEQAVRTGNPRHVILRTAWVFSPYGANFVKTMIRLGQERSHLRVVNDQIGCPTVASDVAAVTSLITLRLIDDAEAPLGTYHFVNRGSATWYTFALELFTRREAAGFNVPEIEAITTEDYPTPARRPRNSQLSTEKLKCDYGVQPRDWPTALGDVLTLLPSDIIL